MDFWQKYLFKDNKETKKHFIRRIKKKMKGYRQ